MEIDFEVVLNCAGIDTKTDRITVSDDLQYTSLGSQKTVTPTRRSPIDPARKNTEG